MKSRILSIVAICLSLLLFNGCYLIKQGTYILRYNFRAQKIDKVLNDPETPEPTREFLDLVQEIGAYATDSIGLKKNRNYTTYVKIDKDYLVDVVSAAEDVSFKQYKWCYPFFGCFPLKGYFEKEDALKEAEKLKGKGYDVNVDEVDGFSTLGIFKDPLYSFMKDFSVFGIASFIIHEQTHATVYVKNQVQFSEELATFVGNTGAMNFIRQKYGTDSDIFRSAVLAEQDREAYLGLLRGLYNELKSMYQSGINREEKLNRKEEIIADFKEKVSTEYNRFFKTGSYSRLSKININNAYLAIRMTYTNDLKLYQELYIKEGENLKSFMDSVIKLSKKKGDLKEHLMKEINK